MSTTLPPPPAGSARRRLAHAGRVATLLAVGLFAASAVRFAIEGFRIAWRAGEPNFAERPAPHAAAARAEPSAGALPRGPERGTRSAAAPRGPGAPPEAAGAARRITLAVTAGPPRSEVYVDGVRVGQTPFLGDSSCRAGAPLRVELLPPSGPPLRYERSCAGGTVEISGPPP